MELPSDRFRIFKTKWFERFARKQGMGDAALVDAVARAKNGLVDADLGGGVIKQRVARPGRGKSGGYRTIVFFRRGERAVFVYGFAKSDRANVDGQEVARFKEAARYVLELTEEQIETLVARGNFVEVKREQEISQ